MNSRLKALTLYTPNVNYLHNMLYATKDTFAQNRLEKLEPISPLMPPDKPSIPLENLQTPHSYLSNFIKDAELWPPSPHSTSDRDQQEANIQKQDRNRHYFCLPKKKCMRFGENEKSYCLDSRVFNFPHPSRPCQTKK